MLEVVLPLEQNYADPIAKYGSFTAMAHVDTVLLNMTLSIALRYNVMSLSPYIPVIKLNFKTSFNISGSSDIDSWKRCLLVRY